MSDVEQESKSLWDKAGGLKLSQCRVSLSDDRRRDRSRH